MVARFRADFIKKNTYLVEKGVRRKGNKVLVKWLGFSKTSWINKEDIIKKDLFY